MVANVVYANLEPLDKRAAHTTTNTSMEDEAEKELSFPGADSGHGRAWEDKIKLAVRLLPERDGHRPGVVLEARAPAKLTVTAAQVLMSERRFYGPVEATPGRPGTPAAIRISSSSAHGSCSPICSHGLLARG